MGNSSNPPSSNLRFCDENLYKIELKGHFSKIFGTDLYHLKDSNTLIISTISKDGKILVYKFKDKDIRNLTCKKKSKTTSWKNSHKYVIPLRSSYNMTTAVTYCNNLKSILIANGGLDNLCNFHQICIETGTHSRVGEAQLSEGYTSNIKFINDNSNRVIFGSGDGNVYIYDYIQKCQLLKIEQSHGDVTCIDYFLEESNRLIIGISYIDGKINVVTINDKNYNNMEIINTQCIITMETDICDVNCIAFSPNEHEFIACGGDDGICVILIRNAIKKNKENIVEYDILCKEEIPKVDINMLITTCCWVDSHTVIVGTDESGQTLDVLRIITIQNSKECLDIIAQFLNRIDFLAQLVVEYCGYDVDKYTIKTPFNEHQRVPQITSLPDYEIAPGVFVACSWNHTSCLYIPMERI
eukprot:383135_1